MSRRTRLALARAAALIILVTGISGVIPAPRYGPIVAYTIAILIAGVTGGFGVALIAAVASIILYALLFGAPSIVVGAVMLVAGIAGAGIRRMRKVEDSRPRLSGQAGAPVLHSQETQTEDINLLAAERARAAGEMNDALDTIHRLHDELDSARADADQLRRANLELQEQEREGRTAGSELLGRADTLIAELSAQLERERQGRAADAEEAREREERLHQQYEAESEHVQSAAAKALEEIQRLEETKARLADVTASYEQVSARVSELQQALGRAEATRAQLEASNDELRRRFEVEIAKLDQQWNDKLQKIVNELATDHENDLGEAVAAREQARAEVRSLNSRVQELEKKLRESEAARAAVPKIDRQQIDAEWSAKLQKIVNELAADHENDLGEAVAAREQARAEARSLTSKAQELEKKLRESEAKLQKIVNELAADHENDLGEAVAAREQARAEARSLNLRVQELEKKLRENEAATAAVPKIDRQQIDAEWSTKLQKIINELVEDQEQAIGEALERREEARAELRSVNNRVQELEKRLRESEARVVAAPKVNREQIDAEWSKKVQDIVAHLASDHEADLGIAIEAREAARAEARSLNQRLMSLEQELTSVRAKLADAEAARPADEFPFGPMVAPPDMQLPDESDDERRARAEVLQFAEQANAALQRANAPDNVPLPPQPLVLFVHHDPAMRNLYSGKLQSNGYRVLTAVDGLEGLRLAKTHRPEVIIADTVMPKMDGNELCQLIKSNEETAAAKVVLMSGTYTNEMPNGLKEQTFQPDEVMRKPVKFDALKNTLTNLLAKTA